MLEKNKIYLGDCLEVMKDIDDESIDLIFSDLPFGTTNLSWDLPIDLDKLWEQYNRIIKSNGAILLFAQSPFDKILGCSNLKMLRYEWIWEKGAATGHLNANRCPLKAHENILVFYKKQPTYNPQMTEGHVRKVSKAKNRAACIERRNDTDDIYNNEYADRVGDYDSTTRYPRSVIKFSTDKQKSNLHKTQKPVALCEYLIKTYTNEGDIVLDSCIGSGTTAIAAINTGRSYIGIEKDEKYFNITNKRIEEL
jgi:site-specific DNA-methyltransferase (adenine-specific)